MITSAIMPGCSCLPFSFAVSLFGTVMCGSHDCVAYLKENNMTPSMSRRGNCHDNAVAESFFATFKKRVTQRKIYSTRSEAKTEIFNFIEMFYNPVKRHSHNQGLSPVEYERAYFKRLGSV